MDQRPPPGFAVKSSLYSGVSCQVLIYHNKEQKENKNVPYVVIRQVMTLATIGMPEGTHDIHTLILGRLQAEMQPFTGA
jgi:hypothetical protein